MDKKELLYEGKAKKVFSTENPDYCIVSYKDDATAFNGEKKGTIIGKGVVNNRMSNFMFKLLEEKGIPTDFVEELNDRDTVLKKVEIVPLEVIVRNKAAGSLSKRLGLPEGTPMKTPVLEFCYKNDELALRWLQLGVFSPIMRLHSTCCEFNGKEPWRYRKEVELIMDKFLRLRHQMIPYLHTMNRRASEEGIPLIQPLYYQNPGKWDAFRMKNEYYFGSDILVNPITQPVSTATRMGKVMTLLPEGTWIDLFTGTVYNGDRKIELYRSLDSIPVLAKAGAIVTLDARTTGNKIDNPDILKVIVAAGADGSFRLDEEATDNVWCSTTFTYQWGDEAVLTITPEKTKLEGMPAERAYELIFAGTAQGMTAQKKKADGTYETLETSYDSDKQCTTVILPMQDIESEITVVTYNTALADNHQVERIFELLNRAEIEFSLKEQIYAIAQKKGSRNDAYLLDQLTLLNAPEDVFGAVKEILTALD